MIDFLFDGVVQEETIDDNFTFLTNSQSSVGGLNVDHWIPIRIKNHHFIRTF